MAKLTQAGISDSHYAAAVMGTAGHMSPEQVRGAAIDARSGIFSFGAILYEMLFGKRAFHGVTTDTLSSILKEDPPELNETNRNVFPALERIVQHCLEKNPESRVLSPLQKGSWKRFFCPMDAASRFEALMESQ